MENFMVVFHTHNPLLEPYHANQPHNPSNLKTNPNPNISLL